MIGYRHNGCPYARYHRLTDGSGRGHQDDAGAPLLAYETRAITKRSRRPRWCQPSQCHSRRVQRATQAQCDPAPGRSAERPTGSADGRTAVLTALVDPGCFGRPRDLRPDSGRNSSTRTVAAVAAKSVRFRDRSYSVRSLRRKTTGRHLADRADATVCQFSPTLTATSPRRPAEPSRQSARPVRRAHVACVARLAPG